MRIKRGSDFRKSFQAKVNGAVLNLTGASIYFSVKPSANSDTIYFQLKNTAAGGSDNEIEIVSASDGLILIKGDRLNTLDIERINCVCDCYVSMSGSDYIVLNEEFIIEKTTLQTGEVTTGGSAAASKQLVYLAEDNATLTRISGKGWTDEPSVKFSDSDIEITSDESEFTLGRTHLSITNDMISYEANGAGSSTAGTIIIKPGAEDYPFEFSIWLY